MKFPSSLWRLGNKSTAAVEFALIVPVLLILMIGTAEVLMLYRTEAKLNQLAGNIAQMVSVQNPYAGGGTTGVSTGTGGTLGDYCKGAGYGLQPFPPKGLTIAIASVTEITAPTTNPVGPGTYDYWEADKSCASTATSITATTGATSACAIALAAPSMLVNPYDNAIIVRATLTYPGIIGIIIGAAPTLKQTSVGRWRYASSLGTPPELKCSGTDCTTQVAIPCT